MGTDFPVIIGPRVSIAYCVINMLDAFVTLPLNSRLQFPWSAQLPLMSSVRWEVAVRAPKTLKNQEDFSGFVFRHDKNL